MVWILDGDIRVSREREPPMNALSELGIEELDRLHATVVTLLEQIAASQVVSDDLVQQLIALKQATRHALEARYTSRLHHDANGQLLACPACGSLRITYRDAPRRRACCQECGLPCELYSTSWAFRHLSNAL
jgi:hypothetical protein